jgi:hypothetical protein
MGYVIDFLGLVNFFDPKAEGVQVLLPDGRENSWLPGNIPEHHASFFVRTGTGELPNDLISADWWRPVKRAEWEAIGVTEFRIPDSSTVKIGDLDAVSRTDPFDASQQFHVLAKLLAIDKDFEIDPGRAETIAQMVVRRGKLEAFKLVESIVSRLTVRDHRGEVVITAQGGTRTRTLTLREGSEIVLANMSDPTVGHSTKDEDDHFRIYANLDVNRRYEKLQHPPISTFPRLDDLVEVTNHTLISYLAGGARTLPRTGCSNTGCCAALER